MSRKGIILILIKKVSCIMDYLLPINFAKYLKLWLINNIWQELEVHIQDNLEIQFSYSLKLGKPCIID